MRPCGYASRIVLALSAALIVCSAQAQVKPKRTDIGEPVQSTMWVGNSFFYFNNSMAACTPGISLSFDTRKSRARR